MVWSISNDPTFEGSGVPEHVIQVGIPTVIGGVCGPGHTATSAAAMILKS